jgi:hypothetical protein
MPDFMLAEPDPQFRVPGGTLLYHPKRDSRLPYIHIVDSHPLVDRTHVPVTSSGRILIYIQDTSEVVMKAQDNFEEGLDVPLGPETSIQAMGLRSSYIFQVAWFNPLLGLFPLYDDDIILARELKDGKLGDPKDDVAQAWVCNGSVVFDLMMSLAANPCGLENISVGIGLRNLGIFKDALLVTTS